MGRLSCILYVVPVNSHFARVWFPEFLAGDDLEETEQLAAVGEVGEEVVHLHLGLQQEAVHPFCESLLLDVQPLLLQGSEMKRNLPDNVFKIKMSDTNQSPHVGCQSQPT